MIWRAAPGEQQGGGHCVVAPWVSDLVRLKQSKISYFLNQLNARCSGSKCCPSTFFSSENCNIRGCTFG